MKETDLELASTPLNPFTDLSRKEEVASEEDNKIINEVAER